MQTLQLDLSKQYSYADYLTWIDGKRKEIINGFVQLFATPARKHQKVSGYLFRNFINYLYKKECEVYSAPFDVRLPKNGERKDKDIYTVVQPDIVVVCDKNKLDIRGCIGAPDLIVEITSKSTAKKDAVKKYDLYEKHGVREYWLVRPDEQTVTVFVLDKKGKYNYIACYPDDAKVPVNIFNGDLVVDLKEVFIDD